MLRRTMDLGKVKQSHFHDDQGQLNCLQSVRNKLQIILQQLVRQKSIADQRFRETRQQLEDQLASKNSQIEQLQSRLRYVQGENSQMKFQYQQKLSLNKLLRQQNALLQREHQREKEQIKTTLEALIEENRELKDALIEAHIQARQRKRRGKRSPEDILKAYYSEKYDSYRDLSALQQKGNRRLTKTGKSMFGGGGRIGTQGAAQTEEVEKETNLSKSSVGLILRRQTQQFRQHSRATRIKVRRTNYNEGLQKMQTRTHLSRMHDF